MADGDGRCAGSLTVRFRYPTLDAALADAEAGLARWMRDELEITDSSLPGSL